MVKPCNNTTPKEMPSKLIDHTEAEVSTSNSKTTKTKPAAKPRSSKAKTGKSTAKKGKKGTVEGKVGGWWWAPPEPKASASGSKRCSTTTATSSATAKKSTPAAGVNSAKKSRGADAVKYWANDPKAYQFKVTLIGSNPSIWRRVEVPEFLSFNDLHWVIVHAMGWSGVQGHVFSLEDVRMGCIHTLEEGVVDENTAKLSEGVVDENTAKLSDHFSREKFRCIYEYDLGDSWQHDVVLEEMIDMSTKVTYPRCVAGERACPPEECGGLEQYEHMLEVLAVPTHDEYQETKEWLKEMAPPGFKPDKFNPKAVKF